MEKVQALSDIGLDDISLTWVDYTDGIARWEEDVIPLLEKAGLRKPFEQWAAAAA